MSLENRRKREGHKTNRDSILIDAVPAEIEFVDSLKRNPRTLKFIILFAAYTKIFTLY